MLPSRAETTALSVHLSTLRACWSPMSAWHVLSLLQSLGLLSPSPTGPSNTFVVQMERGSSGVAFWLWDVHLVIVRGRRFPGDIFLGVPFPSSSMTHACVPHAA